MAKAKTPLQIHFELDEVICKQGKYANKEPYGNESASRWEVLFEDIMLTCTMYRDMTADPKADEALFVERKGVLEPRPWLKNVELKYLETFEEAVCEIRYSAKHSVELEKCEVKIHSLQPMTTGVVRTAVKVTFTPTRAVMVAVHEHQHTEVRLSISNAKVAEKKKSTQQEMFEAGQEKQDEEESEEASTPPKLDGSHLTASAADSAPTSSESSPKTATDDAAEFEAGAKKQVEAYNAQPGSKAIDGRSEAVKNRDRRRGAH